jgi:outer membrane protein assembly factor BamE
MMPWFRLLMLTLLTITCLGITACSFLPRIYRMDVRQGNYISKEMVEQLKIGMSRETVQALMGTPALSNFFEANTQWNYYYYLKPGSGDPIQEKSITIYFKNNRVVRLEETAGCQ